MPLSIQVAQDKLTRFAPGVFVSAIVGMAAAFVSVNHGGPTLLYALLIGMALHSVTRESKAVAGIGFSSRTILRIGVALLGARISFAQIASLGWSPVLIVLLAVGATIVAGAFAAQRLGLSRDFGVLTGGAVAICGASAALAISAVLPSGKDKERDTLFTVVAVTILSTVAMVIYPLVARALGLGPQTAGLLIGATIHDVAQVVAAGHMLSDEVGIVATYVKLLRVALLLPVVVGVAWLLRSGTASSKRPTLPFFLIVFAALVAVNSTGLVPSAVTNQLADISRWCLICAIAALGMKTSLDELAEIGFLPLALVVAETLFLLGLVSVAIWLTAT